MARRTRNQLRRMPELLFFGDDSLDYIEEIDKSLRGEDATRLKIQRCYLSVKNDKEAFLLAIM